MDPVSTVILVVVVVVGILAFVKNKKQKDKRKKSNDIYDSQQAELWKVSYANPESPNYDPVRVAAEIKEFEDSNIKI